MSKCICGHEARDHNFTGCHAAPFCMAQGCDCIALTLSVRTKSGKLLTAEDIERLADEAEKGYDPSRLRPRRRDE